MQIEGSPLLSSLEKQPAPEFNLDSLKYTAEGDDLLEELYDDLNQCAHRYFDRVLNHERVGLVQNMRMETEELKQLHERLDHARRLTHNALCDKMRILARAEHKLGRDTTWLTKIAGPRADRVAIAQWTLKSVFDDLRKEEEENE